MKTISTKSLLVASLNMLTIFVTGIQSEAQPVPTSDSQSNVIQNVNSATLKSIESSWIKVPVACKGKGFNADPQTVIEAPMSKAIAEIFESYSSVEA